MHHYLGPSRSLTVSGNAFERARQQSVLCARELPRAASSIASLVVEPRWTGASLHEQLSMTGLSLAGAYYLARHRAALKSHASGKYWQAQRGLAQGANLSTPLMFGLGAVPEIVGAQMGYTMGCTAVALQASVTDSGGAQIAYNHDFPPRFGRYSFVRRNDARGEYSSVSLAYPIMVGCLAGVNERGLAVTLNHAFSTDYRGAPGILLTSLVQDCLDRCATVKEAIELFTEAPVTNGALLTLADESGDRAVVERSCTAARVRRSDSPLLVSFNKYRVPEMEAHEVPLGARSTGIISGVPLHESNIEREKRYRELLPSLISEGDDGERSTMNESNIRRLMNDHRGGDGDSNTICRHGDALSETLWGAIIDTKSRTLRVTFGHACSGPYVEHGLNGPKSDVQSRRAEPYSREPLRSSSAVEASPLVGETSRQTTEHIDKTIDKAAD